MNIFKPLFFLLLALCLPIRLVEAAPKVEPAHADSANPAADKMFAEPYVDIDEWRDTPVRHRYVHGGFKNTDMRFSFYLPPKKQFQSRFFQYVTPVPDNENLSQTVQAGDNNIGFAAASGAYFIETNGGGKSATAGPAFFADPTIGAYRANAAAARYSRVIAAQMYDSKRIYGYLYGGSGGGYRTMGSMENTVGVWDGAVPFVLGSPMASPNNFSVRMHAMRILKGKFPQIVDAMDAGGSGDPYQGLNAEEASALREVTQMGFPPKSWFGHKTMGVHAFTAIYQGMVMADPSYFTDFWTKPGYLGFDNPKSLEAARLQFVTKIGKSLNWAEMEARGLNPKRLPGQPREQGRGSADLAWQKLVSDDSGSRPLAFELADTPPDRNFIGGDLYVLSGESKGKRIALVALGGNVVTLGVVGDLATLAKIKPGDDVRVDNSNFLAAQTYHRHQVPDASYYTYNQFRGADGKPIYPQRPMLLGPMFTKGAAGSVPSGTFNGKIIVVESGLDREAWPWNADWYAKKFDATYGKEAPNKYRVWFAENALHGYNEDKDAPTRVVSYLPILQQALRDVSAWVERGVKPADNSEYMVSNGQVSLAADALRRKGVQPVVTLTANGKDVVRVKRGETVKFVATVYAPPGSAAINDVKWGFETRSGAAKYTEKYDIFDDSNRRSVRVEAQLQYNDPGTFFTTAKGSAQRPDAMGTPYARVDNLARVRVIVE